MDRLAINYVAIQVATWLPIFLVLFLPLFLRKHTSKQQPYLKRVARKYSIRPLDLR